MVGRLLTLLFLFAAAQAASVESPIPTPCDTSKLKSELDKVSFNTSSLLCSNVWKDKDFVLMFHISDDFLTWSFVLSAPAPSAPMYIAVGFSKDGNMVGSSAVAGWLTSSGKGTVKQYALSGKAKASDVKPDRGDLVLKPGATIYSTPKRQYLAFQLDTSSNQPQGKLLYATGKAPGSDGLLTYHGTDRISTTITFHPESNKVAPSPAPVTPLTPETAGAASPPKKNSADNSAGGLVVPTVIPALSALLAMLLF